uniref:Uncharacterized protein n=1 Tax=Mycena chlorophos TaxID=658473 RepID=A0ABQ0M4G6_MYCCL|nr:predicted protein [Mycena chlorophos]
MSGILQAIYDVLFPPPKPHVHSSAEIRDIDEGYLCEWRRYAKEARRTDISDAEKGTEMLRVSRDTPQGRPAPWYKFNPLDNDRPQ